jgi:hypothetical protein
VDFLGDRVAFFGEREWLSGVLVFVASACPSVEMVGLRRPASEGAFCCSWWVAFC